MQFSSSVYGDDKFWRDHKNLIRNFKNIYKSRYRELSLELLNKNSINFPWKKCVIEVSLESHSLMQISVWVKKDGKGIGGASRFIFQGFTKKRWIINFLAQLEAGLEEVFVDIPRNEINEIEVAEESEYLSKIFALEEQRIDFYSSLARDLKRNSKLSIEYEDVVINYKLGLAGCSYSIIYRDEIGGSALGYTRLGWRRKDQLRGLPFIFARNDLEYGQCD